MPGVPVGPEHIVRRRTQPALPIKPVPVDPEATHAPLPAVVVAPNSAPAASQEGAPSTSTMANMPSLGTAASMGSAGEGAVAAAAAAAAAGQLGQVPMGRPPLAPSTLPVQIPVPGRTKKRSKRSLDGAASALLELHG